MYNRIDTNTRHMKAYITAAATTTPTKSDKYNT